MTGSPSRSVVTLAAVLVVTFASVVGGVAAASQPASAQETSQSSLLEACAPSEYSGPIYETDTGLQVEPSYQTDLGFPPIPSFPDHETVVLEDLSVSSQSPGSVRIVNQSDSTTCLQPVDPGATGVTLAPAGRENVTVQSRLGVFGFRDIDFDADDDGPDLFYIPDPFLLAAQTDDEMAPAGAIVIETDLDPGETVVAEGDTSGETLTEATVDESGMLKLTLPSTGHLVNLYVPDEQPPLSTLGVTNVSVPATVTGGESLRASVTVQNFGQKTGTQSVALRFDGDTVNATTVQVEPTASRTVRFSAPTGGLSPGEHVVTVATENDYETRTVRVRRGVNLTVTANRTTVRPGEPVGVTVRRADTGAATAATVTVANRSLATGADGRVVYVPPDAGNYTVTASKSPTETVGFRPSTTTVRADSRTSSGLSLSNLSATVTPAGNGTLHVRLTGAVVDGPLASDRTVAYRVDSDGDGRLAADETVANATVAAGRTGTVSLEFAVPVSAVAATPGTYRYGVVSTGSNVTGRVTVIFPQGLPGNSEAVPTDPDGDGRYEDVDGNGRVGFADVLALAFADADAINQVGLQRSALDFDADGSVDFRDVVALAFDL